MERTQSTPPAPPQRSLTLSFLSASSAASFVRIHLRNKYKFHNKFAGSEQARWSWLPPSALSPAISQAVATQNARRSICIRWPADSSKSERVWQTRVGPLDPQLEAFGNVLVRWEYDEWHLIVTYDNILSGIKARNELPSLLNGEADVQYFPDWTEVPRPYRLAFSKHWASAREYVATREQEVLASGDNS